MFPSTTSHGFFTFSHEVYRLEEEEGESTFLLYLPQGLVVVGNRPREKGILK